MAIIEKIHISKFRNLSDQYFLPNSTINLIIGNNGHGKTNFIESLYYLGHGRSFKTRKLEITESIKNGADEIDIVINRGFVLQNNWKKLYEEVADFKKAAKNKHIKAILGVGDLETLRNVAKASMVCMMAGADFIKTSTGKESVNANLDNSLVMLRMIRHFYQMTGKKIGFKPAGGISTAKTVIEFLILVMEELGHDWINPKYLRIGASSLLIDIERQLYHFALGRYANKEKLAIG